MRIFYDPSHDFFYARCTFEQRFAFKRRGWTWRMDVKKWTTREEKKAREFEEIAEPCAKARLAELDGARHEAVAASYATDSDITIPVPPGLSARGYQKAFVEFALNKKDVILGDPPGLGKAQPVNEPVLKEDGTWVEIGSVVPGDRIIAGDGSVTTVTGVYPQGILDSYRVTFRDGTFTHCCDQHLWAVWDSNSRKRKQPYRVKTLRELLDRGIRYSNGKNKWSIPLAQPVEYSYKSLPIDPYILGLLIGDGYLHGSSIRLTVGNSEVELIEEVESRLPEYTYLSVREGVGCQQVSIVSQGHKIGIMQEILKSLGLRVRGSKKRIPRLYLTASIAQRTDLLRGLMDSDGSCSKNRSTFHNTNEALANDVAELVRSLGGISIVRKYLREDKESYEADYQVNVKMDVCPFMLTRKVSQWRKSPTNGPKKFIQNVERAGTAEMVCISVDHPSCLYLTRDYIVTHNTIQAILLSNVDETINRILVLCPASLKDNWKKEFERWTTRGFKVCIPEIKSKQQTKKGKIIRKWKEVIFDTDANVFIINPEMLSKFRDELRLWTWDHLIVDECHGYKNAQAQRTQELFGRRANKRKKLDAVKPLECRRRVFLSGTPLLSRPSELWVLCRECDKEGLGRDYITFITKYCDAYKAPFGWVAQGRSNTDELALKLRKFMIRRNKVEVLPELPDKSRQIIELPREPFKKFLTIEENTVRQGLEAYEAMLKGETADAVPTDATEPRDWSLEEIAAYIAEKGEAFASFQQQADDLEGNAGIIFEEYALARQELALAKVDYAVEHIQRILDAEEKVIVFAVHADVVEALVEHFPQAACIYGKTPNKKRQAQVDKFQEDPKCDVFIGNIAAAGVGHTLTAASTVVFLELAWTPGEIEQAEDRAWRIGQDNAVLIQYLMVQGSLDTHLIQTFIEKLETTKEVLDTDFRKR